MDVANDGDRRGDVDDIALAHEQLFGLGTYCLDDGLGKELLLVEAGDALIEVDRRCSEEDGLGWFCDAFRGWVTWQTGHGGRQDSVTEEKGEWRRNRILQLRFRRSGRSGRCLLRARVMTGGALSWKHQHDRGSTRSHGAALRGSGATAGLGAVAMESSSSSGGCWAVKRDARSHGRVM